MIDRMFGLGDAHAQRAAASQGDSGGGAPSALPASSVVRALRRAAAALSFNSSRSPSARRDRSAEPALTGSACPPRGGPASRFLFPVFAGSRSGAARALAGTFLLLSLGALAALPAQAQTLPAVPNLSVTAVADTTDKLNVSWDAYTGATVDRYIIRWKTGNQTYGTAREHQNLPSERTVQLDNLTSDTAYDVQVTAVVFGTGNVARSDVTGT